MRHKQLVLALGLLLLGAFIGYLFSKPSFGTKTTLSHTASEKTSEGEREVLYWYDPMYPATRFEKPGKSPFMDMALVPRYQGDEAGADVRIDPAQVQNLAVKTEKVIRAPLSFASDMPANIEFNNHKQARIQPRAEGFVEQTPALSLGDPIKEGAPIVTITIPAFAADQSEYLLLKEQNAAPEILLGLREKMRLSGMPPEMLRALDETGKVQTRMTIASPVSGVVTSLDVYMGMNVGKEMTLATIQGTNPIWITAHVPEADLQLAKTPSRIRLVIAAYPERVFEVTSATLLPRTDEATRTTPLRLTVQNAEGLLKPGMSASIRLRGKGEEALLVPTQSIIDMGEEKRVIVRTKEGVFIPRMVQVLKSAREHTAISGGVEEGEEVVTSGLFLIDSEANLQGALDRMRQAASPVLPVEGGTAKTTVPDTVSPAAATTPTHAH